MFTQNGRYCSSILKVICVCLKTVVNFMKIHLAIKCDVMCDGHRFILAINPWTWVPVPVSKQLMTFYKSLTDTCIDEMIRYNRK